jgi:hypothetical protein
MHVEPTVRALSGLGCTRICVLGVSARRGQQLADMSPHRHERISALPLSPSLVFKRGARTMVQLRVHVHFAFCWK